MERDRVMIGKTAKPGTIRDVAREAGLSIATVSRVINGLGKVRPATREKVMEACEKLDYVPNPAARLLSTKRSRTVAAIIPTIEHSVFAKYIAAIEKTLNERDYTLVLAISNGDPDEELRAARKLLGMGAEAVILSGAEHGRELLDLFRRRRVCHVFTSIWDADASAPAVGYDNYALARRAVEFLSEHGHRQIAVVHGPLHDNDRTRARHAGAGSARSSSVALEFFETTLSVEGGKSALRRVLESARRPSATLCFSDVLALGAYFELADAGLRIPADMSVMGFDNLDWSAHASPPLTTIDLPAEQMGVEVATQLMRNLEKGVPLVATHLAADIIYRSSVRRA